MWLVTAHGDWKSNDRYKSDSIAELREETHNPKKLASRDMIAAKV